MGGLFTLVLLLLLALQLPATQDFLTRKAESIAREQLATDLGIGRIRVDWLNAVTIQDVYLNNPAGDSIARLGELHVAIDLWQLIDREVAISEVRIEDVFADVRTTDSTSNIAFLLEAFVTNSVATDSILTNEVADTAAQARPWTIAADGAELSLQNADVFYQDDPAGLLADLDLRSFALRIEEIDLEGSRYAIDYAELDGAEIDFTQRTVAPTDTTSAPVGMELAAGRLTVKEVTGRLQLDELATSLVIPLLNLEGTELALGETLVFNGEVFQLDEVDFTLDQPGPRGPAGVIDYNHLAVLDITTELTDLAYVGDSLHLVIRHLSGTEKSGLALRSTKGAVIYTPELLQLEDFLLRTTASELRSPATRVNYAFTENADPATLEATAELSGHLGLADLARLTPALAQVPLLRENSGKRFDFGISARGDGRKIRADVIRLSGPGVKLRATATAEQPFDTARLAAKLNILELDLQPGPVIPLLPDSLLPPSIDWPQRILTQGVVNYTPTSVAVDLYAREERPNPLDLLSRLRVAGSVQEPQSFPNSSFDLRLDTVLATRPTILAYLPENTLPPGYQLPDYLRAGGAVRGPTDDLNVELWLNLPGDNTFAELEGRVRNVMDPDRLKLDLQLKNLAVAALDVRSILPDSLLPANLNLPDLRVTDAQVSGGLDDLTFDLPLRTDNGDWNLSGTYRPENVNVNVDLRGFVLHELFTGEVSDTLKTLDLQPLDLQATVTGRVEPGLQLAIDATVDEAGRDSLLLLQALVEENTYSGEFYVNHPDFAAEGAGLYSLGPDSVATAFADLRLDRVDLERWDITEVPLFLSGELRFDATGLDPYGLDATLLLDDVLLRGNNGSSFVDSLLVVAKMQNRVNDVRIESDVLEGQLTGTFDPLDVAGELERFLRGYWEEDVRQPDPFRNGSEMTLDLSVKRTRPLTGGLVAGLTELRPFTLNFTYRDADPGLKLDLMLPALTYGGIEVDQLNMTASGDTDTLGYTIDLGYLSLSEQFELGRTQLRGRNRDGAIDNNFRVWSEQDSLRHQLAFTVDPETDDLTLRLDPVQLLNFKTWSVPPDNLIALRDGDLTVNNFALARNGQRLAARTDQPNNVLVELDNFELGTVARLLNTEEQLFGGVVNGTAELDNAMTKPGLQADLTVVDIRFYEQPLGNLAAQVSSSNENTYRIDVEMTEAGNAVFIDGTYNLDGPMNLTARLERLALATAEPFSLGYLRDAEGFLTGEVAITGTAVAPRLNGQLRFRESALRISLLGEKFRLSEDPIRLNGAVLDLNGLKVFDSQDGVLSMDGTVTLNSVENVVLDLRANTDRFLALNSDADDNELYYGQMAVAADVEIGGTARLPVLDIEARPVGEGEVTYVYTIPEDKGARQNRDIVTFVDFVELKNILRNDTIISVDSLGRSGVDMTLNLDVSDELLVRVIVDPISGQTFTGRANGELALRQFPDGRQEMTGRVELTDGTYDFIFQNVIRKEFEVVAGSSVQFDGSIENPILDLDIRYAAKTEPLPLVTALNPQADPSGLRRQQTFYVNINLDGDLTTTDITTDITYPEDLLGNDGNPLIGQSLAQLRTDESRMTRTAFSLLAFDSFNVPVLDGGSGGGLAGTLNGTLDRAMGQYLNSLAGDLVGFVNLDFGLDSYQDADGQTNRNLRVSASKTLFDDRVIISVDGVTGSDAATGTNGGQAFLDNITAEFLIDEGGTLRLKFFNDRDRDVLVGGNVVRFGGRLVFAKDFERFFWSPKNEEPRVR